MNRTARGIFAVAALALAGCSGNFAAGPSQPNTIPLAGVSPSPGLASSALASPAPSPAANTAVVSFAESQSGLHCPTISGFTCTLRFNIPDAPSPSPSPSGKPKKATPSPAPTPSPTPAASSSGAPSPSPAPTGDTVTLKLAVLPKDAPPLQHAVKDTVAVTPLELLTMTPSANFVIQGNVIAQFTLPHEQIAGRGFALQIFERTAHKNKVHYRPIYSFDKSSLHGNSLDFSFKAPKITVPKGTTYALVLYGGDRPTVTASPVSSAQPDAKPSATPTP